MIRSAINIAVATTGVVSTACTIVLLSIFLSHIPQQDDQQRATIIGTKRVETDEEGEWKLLAITRALIVNVALLTLFMFQHSVFAYPAVKQYLNRCRLQVMQRSIYLITTSAALLFLIKYWQPVRWVVLWHINTSNENHLLWWFFTVLHGYMWVTIYGGSLMRDVSELLGLKQVYYHVIGHDLPLNYKCTEMCRLYEHKRHPSFVSFCILFWVYPCMTFDRLILATIWTLYMILAWNVDCDDLSYQDRQLKKKKVELKH